MEMKNLQIGDELLSSDKENHAKLLQSQSTLDNNQSDKLFIKGWEWLYQYN